MSMKGLKRLKEMNAAKQKASEKARIDGADSSKKVTADFRKGQELGQEILGEEGLGRLQEQEGIQDVQSKLKTQSEGFSDEESLARKESALSAVQQGGQAQSRALQAQLASSGVKGGAAGLANLKLAAQGIQQRGNVERDIFLSEQDAKRTGTQALAEFTSDTSKFDLGQAAAEKNIESQTGLAFAQIGQQDRAGVLQAISAEKQAKASAKGACFLPGTKVKMEDGSTKSIETLEEGDITLFGGAVTLIEQSVSNEAICSYKGTYCTATHEVYDNGEFKMVIESEDCRVAINNGMPTLVYKLNTENGIYIANNFISSNYESPEQNVGKVDMFNAILESINTMLKTGEYKVEEIYSQYAAIVENCGGAY